MSNEREIRPVNQEVEQLRAGFQNAARACREIRAKGNMLTVEKESHHSIVTQADLVAQDILTGWISRMYPESNIISEESGEGKVTKDFWIIDPLDGTSHFERGLDGWSTSAAHIVDGEVRFGATYHLGSDEFFYAKKGEGAFLNGQRLRVSEVSNLKESIVNAGHRTIRTDEDGKIKQLLKDVRTLWTTGSTALVLANLAAGRLDICLQEEQSFWDIAAGILLINEAGGKFTNRQGSGEFEMTGARTHQNDIIATNGILHDSILEYLK